METIFHHKCVVFASSGMILFLLELIFDVRVIVAHGWKKQVLRKWLLFEYEWYMKKLFILFKVLIACAEPFRLLAYLLQTH